MLVEGNKLLLDVTLALWTWILNLQIQPKKLLSEEALTENMQRLQY